MGRSMLRHGRVLACALVIAALLATTPPTGAAAPTAPIGAPVVAPALTVAIPEDSIVADGSFEGGTSSFTSGGNRRTAVVPLETAPDGTRVLEVTPRRRGEFGIDNWPGPVTDAVARAPYRATAYVAATGSQVGRRLTLTIRLTAVDGTTTLMTDESEPIRLTTGFQRVQATIVPRDFGGHIDLFTSSTAPGRGRGTLLVDAVTLTQGLPVPEGFTYADEVLRDRFGDQPGYDLLDNWTFGLTDNKSLGNPWSGTGDYPYWGSGTKGWAPACDYGTPSEEYNLPEQVSQASTGAAYDEFSDEGTGLRITVEPRPALHNGCLYTWVSGAINTRGKQEFGGDGKTVYLQVRARMPSVEVDGKRVANGTWGSIWLLPGEDSSQANSVEVDLQESGYLVDGVDPLRVIASNLHAAAFQVVKDSGSDLSAGFHTYGVKLDTATGQVNLYLDGREYASYPNGPRDAMFLLLNAHVANFNADDWHTQVVDDTASSDMAVAEVRVFEKDEH